MQIQFPDLTVPFIKAAKDPHLPAHPPYGHSCADQTPSEWLSQTPQHSTAAMKDPAYSTYLIYKHGSCYSSMQITHDHSYFYLVTLKLDKGKAILLTLQMGNRSTDSLRAWFAWS